MRARMRDWQVKHYAGVGRWSTPRTSMTGAVVVPAESLFVMGDNRDGSYDGRYWGFLPGRTCVAGPPGLLLLRQGELEVVSIPDRSPVEPVVHMLIERRETRDEREVRRRVRRVERRLVSSLSSSSLSLIATATSSPAAAIPAEVRKAPFGGVRLHHEPATIGPTIRAIDEALWVIPRTRPWRAGLVVREIRPIIDGPVIP